MKQASLDLMTIKQAHYRSASDVAKTINHTRSRRVQAQRVRLWAAHIKVILEG